MWQLHACENLVCCSSIEGKTPGDLLDGCNWDGSSRINDEASSKWPLFAAGGESNVIFQYQQSKEMEMFPL